jgi:DNA-binding NtrC family response regulator
MVVDEDLATAGAIRRGFRDTEITVLSTQAATDAAELVFRYAQDVVILDVTPPAEAHMEVFQQIRRRDSSIPVVFVTAAGSAAAAIEAIERGAFDYLIKPLDIAKLRELIIQAVKVRQLQSVPRDAAKVATVDSSEPCKIDYLVGSSPAMQEVYKAIGRVASKKVNVLIVGESGTGKELVARAIQRHSTRASAPFLAVNCAAIPEALLESELFGHEKGAFTGADSRRVGKFEQCAGGTLFLDEVGDMTPLMQSKVLRVLQEGRFERVGGNTTIETDVRIIAATNRELEQMVTDGHFRADLYYRLNIFTIRLPPLRARTADDLRQLIEHFLGVFCSELGKPQCRLSAEAMERLSSYCWPGNVRELQSVLKRAVLQSSGALLMPEDFPVAVAEAPMDAGSLEAFIDRCLKMGSRDLYAQSLDFMERVLLTIALRHTSGNQSQAAKILHITRGTLRAKIRELGIGIQQTVNVDSENSWESARRNARARSRTPAATTP